MNLRELAKHYAPIVGNDAREYTFVFPNRRAGLFFRKYLSEEVGSTMFAPRLLTINECFRSLSTLTVPDQMMLIFRLYRTYCDIQKGHAESFDSFLYWGKMMLADYNDIDNHLVSHVRQLFTTINDTHILNEEFDFLTKEQKAAIAEFWKDYQESATHHQNVDNDKNPHKRFLYVWELLYPVYEQFRKELKADGLAYEGMLHREVIEHFEEIDSSTLKGKYVFAGFHIRSASEEALMQLMEQKGLATTYIDENEDYLNEKHYPLPKKIDVISVPSDIGQCAEVYRILMKDIHPDEYGDTCIVLPEEMLLLPLLHTLPEDAKINVTMGYPLSTTAPYALMEMLFSLQRNRRTLVEDEEPDAEMGFFHIDVMRLLHCALVRQAAEEAVDKLEKQMLAEHITFLPESSVMENDFLRMILHSVDTETPTALCEYLDDILTYLSAMPFAQTEAIYQLLKAIRRVRQLLIEHRELLGNNIEQKTLVAIIRMLTSDITIPYVGEPLGGLQIMGVLETRALSFKNLIITNFCDDIYPGKSRGNSYIPYILRKEYGLPLPERQDRIFAHNFYSMLAGAEHAWLITNSRADDQHSGEPSRYLMQLRYLRHANICETYVPAKPTTQENFKDGAIQKTTETTKQLRQWIAESENGISPSALSDWLRCPKSFFFSRVLKLREQSQLTDDIAANEFGDCVHAIMQNIYPEGKILTQEQLTNLAKKENLRIEIDKLYSLAKEKHHEDPANKDWANMNASLRPLRDPIAYEAVLRHIHELVRYDATHAPLQVLAAEKKFHTELKVEIGDEKITCRVGGKIDRVDRQGKSIRVVDYKTGKPELEIPDIDSLFNISAKHQHEAFQTLCYCLMYEPKLQEGETLTPHLHAARLLHGGVGDTAVKLKDQETFVWSAVSTEFSKHMKQLIADILDENVPFTEMFDKKACKDWCPYYSFCR